MLNKQNIKVEGMLKHKLINFNTLRRIRNLNIITLLKFVVY